MIGRVALVPIPQSVPTDSLRNLRATISVQPKSPAAPKPVFPEDVVDFSAEALNLLAAESEATDSASRLGETGPAAKAAGPKPRKPQLGGEGNSQTDASGEVLSDEQQQQLRELEARDRQVRTHEQAHLAAAGPYATSGPTYNYQQGPDGKRYAVGGEVGIDTSPIEGDPDATARKARVVRAAALAPAEPSSQDRAVAAKATQMEQQALAEQRSQSPQQGSNTDQNPYAEASRPASGRLLNVIA